MNLCRSLSSSLPRLSHIHTAKCGAGIITIALNVSNNIFMSPQISAGLFIEFMNGMKI